MKYRMTVRTPAMTSLAAMLIACGGGDDSNNSNDPIQADETLQVGGAQLVSCPPAFGFNEFKVERADRIRKFCQIANMAYAEAGTIDNPIVDLTADFMETGEWYRDNDHDVHSGVDFAGRRNNLEETLIAAVADGVVEYLQPGYVVIRSYLPDYGYFALGYMHMDEMTVALGDTVRRGQIIGRESDILYPGVTHLHIDAISCNQVRDLTTWDKTNVETWGNTFEDNGLKPLVIDLYDLVDPIVAGEPIVPPGPFWACIDSTWNGAGSNPTYGSVEAFDYLNLDVLNSDGNVVRSESITSASTVANNRVSLYNPASDNYTFDASELSTLASGNYTLRMEAQINGELKYDSLPFYLTASDETEFVDLYLNRDTYIYVHQGIEVNGCIATGKMLGSLNVTLVQPSGLQFSHLWDPTIHTARIKATDDCNGRPGYVVDRLSIRDNRGKYEGSYSELGFYGVDITVNFADGSSTPVDRMTFEYKNQISDITLTRTSETGSTLLLEIKYVEPSQIDDWFVPWQGTTRFTIDGLTAEGGGTAQPVQNRENGYYIGEYRNVNFFDESTNRYIVTGEHDYELWAENGLLLSSGKITIAQP